MDPNRKTEELQLVEQTRWQRVQRSNGQQRIQEVLHRCYSKRRARPQMQRPLGLAFHKNWPVQRLDVRGDRIRLQASSGFDCQVRQCNRDCDVPRRRSQEAVRLDWASSPFADSRKVDAADFVELAPVRV